MLGARDRAGDAMAEMLCEIAGSRQERGMLAEDRQHGLGDALNQLFGQARGGLGIVAAGGVGQPQQAIESGQTNGLPELQEPLAVQVEHLVEELAEVIPMLIGKSHSCVGGFLTEVLPVAPSADVFQVPQRREARVGKHEGVDSVGGRGPRRA